MDSSTFTFNVTEFRVYYPAFSNVTQFPDSMLTMNWGVSGSYITNTTACGLALSGVSRFHALNLMTAHLTALSVIIASGQVPSLVQAATVDKVNVSLTPPPLETQFQWWLSLTPYGQSLLSLLQVSGVGGFYIGGLPELASFRRVGGVFLG